MAIPASLRREVRERAEERCEYCGLAAAAQEAAFHIDHVIPVVVGGLMNLDNLALACVSCSLRLCRVSRLETGAGVHVWPTRRPQPEQNGRDSVQM
ncbi:MAG: HNH endonuclease [Limisphaerales bacterium]